ncbi:MAG: hypothetical protein RLN76_09230 [Phycisphaeraceae bacterium]
MSVSTRALMASALVVGLFAAGAAEAQLRVVSYNTAGGPRTNLEDVLEAIGDEVRNGFAKPIDVLSLQEQSTMASTTQAIVNLLNGVYGAGTYARSSLNAGSTGAGRPGLIYNTNTVSLVDEDILGTTSFSGPARQFMRYQLRPVGYGVEADFYVYSNHYKASTGSSNEARRLEETNQVLATADALGEGASIIYSGDFNLYSAFEPGYAAYLLHDGPGQAFDPVDRRGAWSNNNNFRDVHTQAPSTSPPGGLVGGGMDDRFDFQLVTGELMDDEGLAYIPGSYHAFGNNGTHTLNQSITTGTGASPTILTLLTQVSDHLPVVADYQLPARAGFEVTLSSVRAVVGGVVDVDVDVTNTAPVVAAIGADELDYEVALLNTSVSEVSGSVLALAGATTHAMTADTSVAGVVGVGGLLTSLSQNTPDDDLVAVESLTVVDAARPSFDEFTEVTGLTVDLGVAVAGSSMVEVPLSVFNLEGAAGFTSALDLDSITPSGNSVLMLNLSTFSGLAAGDSEAGSVSWFVETGTSGQRSASFTLTLSDEDIAGETQHQLTIDVVATIAGELGDFDGSEVLDLGDVELLIERFGTTVPGFDVTEDSVVDGEDFALWRETLFGTAAGDANLDRRVDLVDLSILASNFGGAGTYGQGDNNADGVVDLIDLSGLAANFGFDASAPALVPEPAGVVLVGLGLMGLGRRR